MKLPLLAKVLLACCSLTFLTSCSTPLLSQEQCHNTNWQQMGLNDGHAGDTVRDLSQYIKACKEYDIKIDNIAYDIGYSDGLSQYCSKEHAVELGTTGKDLPVICDSKAFPNMKKIWLANLHNYCTEKLGLEYGLTGASTPQVCNKGTYAKMKKSWQLGINKYCNYQHGLTSGQNGESANIHCTSKKHPSYYSGLNKGLTYFCVPQKAYELGRSGKSLTVKCPSSLVTNFDLAYNKGYKIYEHVLALNNILAVTELRLSASRSKLDELDDDIENLHDDILNSQQSLASANCYADKKPKQCMSSVEFNKNFIARNSIKLEHLRQKRSDEQYYISSLRSEKLAYESELRSIELRDSFS